MPLKSKAQARFLNAKFGHSWMKRHHFGGKLKGLPKHAKAKKR
jgi:hypothetical protein